MDTVKIGAYIALCRKTRGMTQQQLADELGITNKAVSKWETGQGMPDVTILPVLASILSTSVDDLLSGEKTINEKTIDSEIIKNVKNNIIDGENRRFYVAKTIAKLSLFFAILGLVLPYFIWLETENYMGILFGSWLEICSCVVFFAGYGYAKNGIKQNQLVDELKQFKIKWLRISFVGWLPLPSYLVISLICDVFSAQFALKLTLSFVLTLSLYFGLIYWKRASK